MAVYTGMDIGTAKPSPAERRAVPHHLISCFEPHERCDVSRWLALADAALAEIGERGGCALVAGGSPLYAKALLEGLSAGAPRDQAVREELNARFQSEGAEALFGELQRIDPAYASQRHPNDRQRVVRALEVHRLTGRPYSSFHTTAGVRRAGVRTLLLAQRLQQRGDQPLGVLALEMARGVRGLVIIARQGGAGLLTVSYTHLGDRGSAGSDREPGLPDPWSHHGAAQGPAGRPR